MTVGIERHRTAMRRRELSRPMRLAIADGLLARGATVMDYGCGRGGDLHQLAALGHDCAGWDPAHRPDGLRRASSVVNLGYVLNVIEDVDERAGALLDAWRLAQDVLVVSARLVDERSQLAHADDMRDGVVTRINTFQRFYRQRELRDWLEAITGAEPVAAGPGVFYLFRDGARASAFVAARFRTQVVRTGRAPAAAFDGDPELADGLVALLEGLAREPDPEETPERSRVEAAFGSVRRATASAIAAIGHERWERLRRTRREDLLVFLALGRFGRRPAFGDLDRGLQLDVRSHFGSYSSACRLADAELSALAVRDTIEAAIAVAGCGKRLPTAFYFHASALGTLPVPLRLYEGCARALAGTVEGANVVKLSRVERKVSYLEYPAFERDPHPVLRASTRVDLQTFDVRSRDFARSANPPVLHRKEAFVRTDHPLAARFARLTAAEERAGLFADTSAIGTRQGWEAALSAAGVALAGHRLVAANRPGAAQATETNSRSSAS